MFVGVMHELLSNHWDSPSRVFTFSSRAPVAVATSITKVLFALWVLAAPGPARSEQTIDFNRAIDFNRDVRPLLSDRCFACHGPDGEHREADLRLDVESAAKEMAIVSGDPASSLMIERIESTDPDVVMPPPETGKPITPEEREILRAWIEQGAPFAEHWAYVTPNYHPAPVVHETSWTRNWIDTWTLRAMEATGVAPAPEADPITLVRRLSLDLTGLPPTPELVKAFTSNPSEECYTQVVDTLLQSEHFGERMAVYWLDLVRYADTVGYHGDQDHNIAPYRDWVIDAFNANMRFDQFTREQLAGDLIPDATIDQKIATGYNRLLQTSHEGGVQTKEYLAIYAADRVRNVSAVWMGATVGCAQCHDHKYDPYTAKDFYSLAAFFADIDEARHFTEGSNALPTKRPPEIPVLRPAQLDRLHALQQQLAKSQMPNEVESIKAEIEELKKSARLTMVTQAISPREIRLLPRGNWLDDSGPICEPEVPGFLSERFSSHQSLVQPPSSPNRPTRLDLANWLTSTDNGAGLLTARVFANRVWALFFGAGISTSLEDFGGQGKPPRLPELLDNLAIDFAQDWDLKRLVRTLVLSQTYRQSSIPTEEQLALDPNNDTFCRQARYRLPAEMIRDSALAISGLLVQRDGLPSARPYQPEDYYRHLNFPPRKYRADVDENQYRRGVYMHWQRQFLHPMLRAFDAPTREECTATRARSNTPLAALVLLNDPSFVESARGLAIRVLQDDSLKDDDSRIIRAFQLVTSRTPDAVEVRLLRDALNFHRKEFSESPDRAEELVNVGLWKHPTQSVASNQPIEIGAWCEVARILLNLSETMLRP